jgi:site-specific recombinase XerD
MPRAGSVAYQVSKIIKAHNGLHQKKAEARENSGLLGENNHKVSDKFHSYKSLDNARRDLMNLGKFAKEEFGIKDMRQIDQEVAREWIYQKDVTARTASNYLSEIMKVREHFSIKAEEIADLRQEFHQNLPKTREKAQMTRSYKNLDKVAGIINQRSKIAYELQYKHGLRVKEATHINVKKQMTGNILQVQAKGGKPVIVEISKELEKEIREYAKEHKGVYEIDRSTYARDLRSAIEEAGNKWNGTHGMRHSYAQNKLEEGYTKAEVSEAMGHVREEITNVYLR